MCFANEVDPFYELATLENRKPDAIFNQMLDLEEYELNIFDDKLFEFRKRFVHYFAPTLYKKFNERAVNELFYLYMKIFWISGFADLIIEDFECFQKKKENGNKNQIVEVLKSTKPLLSLVYQVCQNRDKDFVAELANINENAKEFTTKQPPKKHNKEIVKMAVDYIKSNQQNLSSIKSDSCEIITIKLDTKTATEQILDLLSARYNSLARTFAIDLDFGKDLDLDDFFDILMDSDDQMQKLIALKFLNDRTKKQLQKISNNFISQNSKILKNIGIVAMSTFDKKQALQVLSELTKPEKQKDLSFVDQLKFIYNSAVEIDQKVTDEVSKYVDKIRSDPKLIQNCIDSINDLDSTSLGAMICLGAEIFDTAVTSFCKVNNDIIQISKLNQRQNYKPSFRIDKPKFDISDQLLNGLQTITNKMDLLTNEPLSLLQNMIICSFISYIDSSGKRQNDIRQKIQNLYRNVVDINSAKDVTMAPDEMFRKIREMKRLLNVKSSVVKFIPINISLASRTNKSSVFSIFPTLIQPNKAFKFVLKPKNTLKYIGLIDINYNVCFLSVFNKYIFLKNKYFKFIGDSFNFTLSFNKSKAYFNDVEVQTDLFDPCFVFHLTVADDNSVNYQIVDFNQTKFVKPKLFDHNFDLSVLFPKKCLGMNVKIDGYDNAFISDIKSDNLYEVTASSNSKIDILNLSCYKLMPQDTDLEDILTRSSFATKIGFNAEENRNQFIDLAKSASLSLLKPIVSKNLSDVLVPQLIRLDLNTDINSQEVKELVKIFQPKINEVTEKINNKLRENEQNPNIRNESDYRRLMNNPNNSIQLAYYNWWRIFDRNHSTIIKYFLNFKKSSDYLLKHYLTHYNFENVNYIDFLNFFERSFFNNQQNLTLVNLEIRQKIVDDVEKLLNERSDIFFNVQNHSLLIKNICEQEFTKMLQHKESITSNSFKAIFLYSNIKQSKMRNIQQNFVSVYPCEVLSTNGSEFLLQPNQQRNDVSLFSYSFNKNNVSDEWKQFKQIQDLKPLYQTIAESRVYHVPLQNCNFNSISIYLIDVLFAHPGFEIPSWTIQINEKINAVFNSFRYPCVPNPQYDTGETWPIIEYNQIVPQTPEQCFIYSFMKIRSQYKTMCSKNRFYTCVCWDLSKGYNIVDAGGPFRESLTSMVEELMDIRFRFFIPPPDSLICERDSKVPSITQSPELSVAIGAAIAACAITNNPRNWLLPEFLWDFLVDNTGRNLHTFVDCTDPNYFNSLAAVCARIKEGFDLVFYPNARNGLCGYILKVMAMGYQVDVDKFADMLVCEDKELLVCFRHAFGLMTTQELLTIFRFFTGTNRLPNSDKKYKIILVQANETNENNFPLIWAFTCTCEANVARFRNPAILKAKLLKSAEYCQNIED
ncbi:hypothetical protein TVAG_226930 [Trichomonas vaginalis G3]|uniref:HECT domain-containing protein n=1 Tax=Trichomonas vaginalis (strain ATCC PRA-98 / G3) TaxID=412133 RepID=A2FCD7_TRIV3|nr:ubiquitin protein ligase protein [Trichomonas vaginalis G3]EAX97449.1 hypothetical protein TVAG_226930 [Trichomonas vaginalis G3]KAI5552007.1 ubiquitin protein ligase protein [Trichomonas vaginalis G3]|eukprot:XP_001310379.1 hypothetical protein [Trichomonas vaginalis G3]